ncbi:inhibitor of apoptosis-promoting Bax1-domain-containing protein [Cunninghamella echinulata]|nr:inhibitor of apoptosis-promoting Bax1-domain-containing protein [Cunninghamella echinulata]
MSNTNKYYTQQPPPYEEEARQPLFGDHDDDNSDLYKETLNECSVEVRLQFVRKVYSILTVQLLATIIMGSIYMFNDSIKTWVQSSQWLLIVSAIGTLVVVFALMFYSRRTPLNYGLLTVFTLLEGHLVGTIVTFYDKMIVLQALIITFGVVFGLTLFTLQSKWDFTGMMPFLFGGLSILFIASLVQIFIPFSETIQLALAVGGVIIFSGYLIVDTYLIFNRYSAEEYIMASLSLYLDIINIFIRVLQILNAMERN